MIVKSVSLMHIYLCVSGNVVNLHNFGEKNVRNTGAVIEVLDKCGFLLCAKMCEKTTRCSAFNFSPVLLLCELIGTKDVTSVEMSGWWFFQNTSMLSVTGNSNDVSGKSCETNTSLVELKSGIFKCLDIELPFDCQDVLRLSPSSLSWTYKIYHNPISAVDVYCDMETDGGGWTGDAFCAMPVVLFNEQIFSAPTDIHVISMMGTETSGITLQEYEFRSIEKVFQSRQDGSVDFYRTWAEYKVGFGKPAGEFWLGNDNLHRLLSEHSYTLRVDLEDFNGTRRYAKYSSFSIGNETDHYKISISGYSGDAGDAASYMNGNYFSTKDADFDAHSKSCSILYKGAWWYGNCHHCNLNGLYHQQPAANYAVGVVWYQWKGYYYSLKTVSMKVKRN